MTIEVQTDDYKAKTNETLGVTIGARFYLTRNRVNPSLDIPTDPFIPANWESYYHTPWGEAFNLYDSNYDVYGKYYPYRWSHIEHGAVRIQSFVMLREIDAGDDIRRMYKNDVSCKEAVIASVGTTENKLLGLVCVPNTNRL